MAHHVREIESDQVPPQSDIRQLASSSHGVNRPDRYLQSLGQLLPGQKPRQITPCALGRGLGWGVPEFALRTSIFRLRFIHTSRGNRLKNRQNPAGSTLSGEQSMVNEKWKNRSENRLAPSARVRKRKKGQRQRGLSAARDRVTPGEPQDVRRTQGSELLVQQHPRRRPPADRT